MPMYQSPYMMGQIPYQPQPQTQSAQRNWVQGINGARAFLVAPGQTVDLWDSEQQVIYLKSADPSGIPSMQILDYTIRSQACKGQTDDYVPMAEFNKLMERVKALEGGNHGEPTV